MGNGQIELGPVLKALHQMKIRSVLVEGGSQVITSFLRSRLVDQFVITIAPVMVGGVRAFDPSWKLPTLPKLCNIHHELMGEDIIVRGDPHWENR